MTPKTPAALEARATPAVEATLTSGRFQGQVAFITGANDKGIGGAIAERFASEGASIVIASLDEPKRLVKKLGKQGNGVVFAPCDVTRSSQIRHSIDAAMEEFGKIDIVVNNAGVEVARPLRKFSEEQWRQMLAVNLDGAIAVTQAALDHLSEPGGVIVNIASALGLGGCAGFSIYSASKAGLIGFTQSLAWELAPRGIRIVGVAPGLVHTPMIHKHIEHLSAEDRRQIEACHPLGIGLPHDVANAVAFLASDEARWITGVTLPLGFAQHYPLPTKSLMAADGHS
jgi:3-oxoacyl-[acyl-carrier protein] reductase